jgi:glycosyltransferase involved in cell wall biosynthesis
MSTAPAASVLLICHDDEDMVEQALESVAAQTFTDFELIVVDDRSADGTAALIRAWLARTGFPAVFLAHETNVGLCASLNEGLAIACGGYVISISGDDWMEPDRLANQVGFFSGLPADVGLVYSDVRVVDLVGAGRDPSYLHGYLGDAPPPQGRVFDEILAGNPIPAAGAMIRRSALDAVGPYDERFIFEDYDMWLRLADRFEVRCLPVVVGNYRILESSMSNDRRNLARIGPDGMAMQLKWLGRSARTDAVIATQIRRKARWVASWNRDATVAALRAVQPVDGSRRWAAATSLLALPGADRAMAGVRIVRERVRAVRH